MHLTSFKKEQIDSVYPANAEKNFWCIARNRLVTDWIRKAGATGAFFDIGCGKGFSVAHLRNSGLVGYGSDLADYTPHPDASEYVFPKSRLSDIPARIAEGVEHMLFLDVLEHLEDPHQLIKEALMRFPSATSAFITVPARSELWTNYDEYYGHFKRYNRDDLHRLARDSGMILAESRYFFHSLYLFAGFVKLFQGRRATSIKSPRLLCLHRILALFFYLEARIVPSPVLGTSIIAHFRRNTISTPTPNKHLK